jgi:hypothetical protein
MKNPKTLPTFSLNDFTREVFKRCIDNDESMSTPVELRNGTVIQITFERSVQGTNFISPNPNYLGKLWALNGQSYLDIDLDLYEIKDVNHPQ